MYVGVNTKNAIFDPDNYNVIDFDPELDLIKRHARKLAEKAKREKYEKNLELLKLGIKQKACGLGLAAVGTAMAKLGYDTFITLTIVGGLLTIARKRWIV